MEPIEITDESVREHGVYDPADLKWHYPFYRYRECLFVQTLSALPPAASETAGRPELRIGSIEVVLGWPDIACIDLLRETTEGLETVVVSGSLDDVPDELIAEATPDPDDPDWPHAEARVRAERWADYFDNLATKIRVGLAGIER